MKQIVFLVVTLLGFLSSAQNSTTEDAKTLKKAEALVYKGNELLQEENFTEAEMEYRKAISKAPDKATGSYNLAHGLYKKGNVEEALFRGEEAAKNAKTKEEKHRAYHNIGNFLMENKNCKQALEAYKNALRNNPNDEETRYNYALAKECANQQEDGGGEDNKEDENKEEEQDKKDQEKKEDENKENQDKNDQGDKDQKKGDEEEDENGKPKEDKQDNGQGEDDKKKDQQKPKPKPGQMSPQQIKNILEAMQNQEQKVQAKMNAEKQKGAKVKTEKDW
ncbi:aerotolerance regulator BatC [Winogradskyella sp. DF17]|jgi:tetratricopeptide (TPR) repeat protein|uniref:Aerotolerance regulator BatC n=1 Tax=Winogradskyella pelagia TaxID=2819984 RepID=A0ABS3SYV6_9FLAO|nr:tetratricopeptide repeat protein [Winogradskyella sp. DF17]MBO3115414.1 aerotolerance regulator BatC [Winogradskyella sp. DF17]